MPRNDMEGEKYTREERQEMAAKCLVLMMVFAFGIWLAIPLYGGGAVLITQGLSNPLYTLVLQIIGVIIAVAAWVGVYKTVKKSGHTEDLYGRPRFKSDYWEKKDKEE